MNISLVEDDFHSRQVMAKFITQLGHKVIESENGEKALAEIKRRKVHFVLSDIMMPVMDGYELLRQIKQTAHLKELIVVLITGNKDVNFAVEALRQGAYDYLLKPVKPEELSALIERIAEYFAIKLENSNFGKNFGRKVKKATKNSKRELIDLKRDYTREVGTTEIGVFSNELHHIFEIAQKLHHKRDIPVIIEGATGTGKEVIARYIHYGKRGITTPFVGLNCAAISPGLFESELFGYESGAFTGGKQVGQKGKIELAQGGTLFFDEITELSLVYQAKLLRVIQEREYYRVGGLKKISADVRFICATNQNIKAKVENGSFRQDLYYRLNVGRIFIPPLCQRRMDIIPLAQMFLDQMRNQKKTQFATLNPDAVKILESYSWPGNVRELKNAFERLLLMYDDIEVKPEHLNFLSRDSIPDRNHGEISQKQPLYNFALPEECFKLEKWTLNIVNQALIKNQWNKTNTARYLGITRRVLYKYLERLNHTK